MSRGKIVIASDNPGARDLVSHGKNGYLFKIQDANDLAEKISLALVKKSKKIGKAAKRSVEKFSWNKIEKKIYKIYR